MTVGVPVYRGELFLEETLHSIAAQTHRALAVVISLDGPQPRAEALCRPFLTDPRFRLVVRPERLGWVGNLNRMMADVTTPFWCYQGQDDLIAPDYLEVLVDAARNAPEGAVFYGDIRAFGTLDQTMAQPSVTGSAPGRQLSLLFDHFPAVAFRGLTRLTPLRVGGGVPTNACGDFACDTAWMSAMARTGDLLRVPAARYRKRYHAGNEHASWMDWPVERRVEAWILHCASMLEQAMLAEASTAERRLLWLATVGRLTAPRSLGGFLPVDTWTPADRALVLEAFLAYVRRSGIDMATLLGEPWGRIQDWTDALAGRADQLRRNHRRLPS